MPLGTATTYDLTEGLYLDFEPMIHMLSPMDVPFQGGYTADGRLILPTDTCYEKMVQWHDEELLTPRSTLAGGGATTGGTVITVATGDQLNFDVGDMLLIGSEYLRVTALGSTADTLVVTRAISGSAGTLTAGTDVIAVGSLLPEGSDPPAARSVDRANKWNLTQIFGPHAIKVSGTENVIRKYGMEGTNEFDHQAANRLKETAIRVEQAIINGVRFESTTDEWRSMGGMLYYITTINDTTTTTLTESSLVDNLQLTFANGGSPDVVACGAKNKRLVSGFTSSGTIRVERADDTAGRVVTYLDSDFGRITIVLNRWFRTRDLVAFERDQASLTTLRPMGFEMLAKTGDSKHGQVLAEKTLRFRRESHAFKMTALT